MVTGLSVYTRATRNPTLNAHYANTINSIDIIHSARVIAGSALALQCCKAHASINRKMGNSTPCKIVTPENFSSKFTRVITSETVTTVQIFFVKIGSVGASPQVGEIERLCDFLTVLSCPDLFSRTSFQVEPLDRFSRFMAQTTCFRARKCLLGVMTILYVIWGKYAPKTRQKAGLNWQFPAIMP